jgi:hypothetical protein
LIGWWACTRRERKRERARASAFRAEFDEEVLLLIVSGQVHGLRFVCLERGKQMLEMERGGSKHFCEVMWREGKKEGANLGVHSKLDGGGRDRELLQALRVKGDAEESGAGRADAFQKELRAGRVDFIQ